MTDEEAQEILDSSANYAHWGDWGDRICIDGHFTVRELEAVLHLARKHFNRDIVAGIDYSEAVLHR